MATEIGEMSPPETTASLLALASASQQPYVSELLSFTLDRLHKVSLSLSLFLFSFDISLRALDLWILSITEFRRSRSCFEWTRSGFRGKCKRLLLGTTARLSPPLMLCLRSDRKYPPSISISSLWWVRPSRSISNRVLLIHFWLLSLACFEFVVVNVGWVLTKDRFWNLNSSEENRLVSSQVAEPCCIRSFSDSALWDWSCLWCSLAES